MTLLPTFILLLLQLSVVVAADWDLFLDNGYPEIDISDNIVFRYSYTGVLGTNKYLTPSIWKNDCSIKGDTPSALIFTNSSDTVTKKFTVSVDMDENLIGVSDYFTPDQNNETATVAFCMRTVYNYVFPGGVTAYPKNMHMTQVTLTVNITNNYEIMTMTHTALPAKDFSSTIDHSPPLGYTLSAYHCSTGYTADSNQNPTLRSGDILRLCVKVNNAVDNMYVKSIRSFVIAQSGSSSSTLINAGSITPAFAKVTDVACSSSNCKIQHVVPSRFYESGNSLSITGIAELGFGSSRRVEEVPLEIHGTNDEEWWVDMGDSTTPEGNFELVVQLDHIDVKESNTIAVGAIIGIVIGIIILLSLFALAVFWYGMRKTTVPPIKSDESAVTETGDVPTVVTTNNMPTNEQDNVGFRSLMIHSDLGPVLMDSISHILIDPEAGDSERCLDVVEVSLHSKEQEDDKMAMGALSVVVHNDTGPSLMDSISKLFVDSEEGSAAES